jgi:16S rRNA (cytidine1402-2'-O)-methyltransferase
MPGILYLIPNTLGPTNAAPGALNHVLPEQVQALTASLDYFVAENAKTARAFLKLIAIDHPLGRPLQEIEIAELNVNTPASETGVPAVADPGADLVRLAHQHGITVRPLVGPSSLLLSVMASGLNGQSFAFNGYLPTDAALRTKRIKELELRSRSEKQTQLLIETPYRNGAMLEALVAACNPGTLICVASVAGP